MIVSGPNMVSNVFNEGRREENTLANSEYLPNDMIQLHQRRISANTLMTSVNDRWDKVTCAPFTYHNLSVLGVFSLQLTCF